MPGAQDRFGCRGYPKAKTWRSLIGAHIVFSACLNCLHYISTKRQRTAALQNAGANSRSPLYPQGFGVRLSSAAFRSSCRTRLGSFIPFGPKLIKWQLRSLGRLFAGRAKLFLQVTDAPQQIGK